MILSIVAVALLAGIVSGLIYGILNLLFVTPYIERAVELEAINAGVEINPFFLEYRAWQVQGSILAALITGMGYSALYMLAYILGDDIKGLRRALILALVVWVVVYLMPILKYPANPPGVGDANTIYYRQSLFVTYMLISGLSALALALIGRRYRSSKVTIGAIAAYSMIMVAAYMLMPNNPDAINMDSSILNGFRISSAFTSLALWLLLGVSTSLIWSKSGLIKHTSLN